MKPSLKYVVYNKRETYHDLGSYEIKVVLNPKHFKNGHESDVKLTDSDGKPMKCEVKRWGRKIVCTFILDYDVSDGVSCLKVETKDDKGATTQIKSTFWVIKPTRR